MIPKVRTWKVTLPDGQILYIDTITKKMVRIILRHDYFIGEYCKIHPLRG